MPEIGPYCPAPGCDVVDGVSLSPEEHAERLAQHPGLRLSRPIELTPEDTADLAAHAADAEDESRVLMVKTLRPEGQGDG